jgi:UDP-hydrolysing UDP-N-acetyl-D-glucosamine 2-epimerase
MIRVLFFSSSRADSGILRPLIMMSLGDQRFDVRVLACGGHLANSQGATLSSEFDYLDSSKLIMIDSKNYGSDIVDSFPSSLSDFLDVLSREQPDAVIVLGDRMETLLFCFAASVQNFPLVHLHGGDITIGALDELHRHAISKLSSLHFPANENSAKRLVQMGEHPETVFAFGSPVQDTTRNREPISDSEFYRVTELSPEEPFFLITMHPALHDDPPTAEHLLAVLEAINGFPEHSVLFTSPNADPQGPQLLRMIENYVSERPGKARLVRSLGHSYLEVLARCDIAIGNSSSLLLEAPLVAAKTLLVGRRQEGRIDNMVTFGPSPSAIASEIERLLSLPSENGVLLSGESVSASILDALFAAHPISTEKRFNEL